MVLSTLRNITRVRQYQPFKVPAPLKISDDQLLVKDLSSFVHHRGVQNKTALRLPPNFKDPDEWKIKANIVNLMRQFIYSTQDRIKHLDKVLDKYAKDVTFRASFIFNKLDQTLLDMRRVYSIAENEKLAKLVRNNIDYYTHIAKKNIDITYIVEHMIAFHTRNMELLRNFKYDHTSIPRQEEF